MPLLPLLCLLFQIEQQRLGLILDQFNLTQILMVGQGLLGTFESLDQQLGPLLSQVDWDATRLWETVSAAVSGWMTDGYQSGDETQ